MNAETLTRRSLNDQIEQARDYRSDEQKLAAAIDLHISNCRIRDDLNGHPGAVSESLSRQADLACESSQAQLWRLIEDVCLCDPRKLAKALSA